MTLSWKTATGKYFAGNLTETLNSGGTGTDAAMTIADNCSGAIQIKVTDQIVYTECGGTGITDGTVFATVTRSFVAIDQRGNDTTVTQIITFKRPTVSAAAGPAYGVSFAARAYKTINGVDVHNYSSGSTSDMIVFNKCAAPTGTAAEVKAELQKYLKSIYRVGYPLPNDAITGGITGTDTAFIFGPQFCNYAVDFTYTEFANCNGGKKFMITTSFADWCPSGVTTTDALVISFEDASAPVFAAVTTNTGATSTTPKNVLGTTSAAPILVSVGTNDCTASLRLGTASNLRDLSTLFNLKVTDHLQLVLTINLNYSFQNQEIIGIMLYYVPQSCIYGCNLYCCKYS